MFYHKKTYFSHKDIYLTARWLKKMLWVIFFFFFLPFLGPLPQYMEDPWSRVELELKPLAYARATATQDLSRVCNLHHSSRQRRILNPLNKARDQTRNRMVPSRICFCCATTGTPLSLSLSLSLSFFRATPTAYGCSQARGWTRTVAASLLQRHSNTGSEPHLQPTL